MPIVRIAWYARPTALGDPRYLVGPSLGAQYLAVPPNWEDTPEAWLETTRPQFRDSVLEATPVPGDILTIGPYAYRIDATGWTRIVVLEHSQTTSLTAGRPLAYGISPLAPRGAYTLADHQAIAQRFAQWIWNQGLFPVLPHLYLPHFLDDTREGERNVALHIGQTWLIQSALVLQLDVPCSHGMAAERALAQRYGRPVEVVPWAALDFDSPYFLDATTLALCPSP